MLSGQLCFYKATLQKEEEIDVVLFKILKKVPCPWFILGQRTALDF